VLLLVEFELFTCRKIIFQVRQVRKRWPRNEMLVTSFIAYLVSYIWNGSEILLTSKPGHIQLVSQNMWNL